MCKSNTFVTGLIRKIYGGKEEMFEERQMIRLKYLFFLPTQVEH